MGGGHGKEQVQVSNLRNTSQTEGRNLRGETLQARKVGDGRRRAVASSPISFVSFVMSLFSAS
jgi:hypothetical protein